MKCKALNLLSLTAGLALALATGARAQVLMSAGSYSQDFNSLAGTGTANAWSDNVTLLGWYAAKSVAPNAVTGYRAGTGSDTAGALYSFGSASSTDRALGSQASGSPGNFAYGIRLVNDTTEAKTTITVTYTGEQWRNGGNTTAQTNIVAYQISSAPITNPDPGNTGLWTLVPALDFKAPIATSSAGALDGNAAANRALLTAKLEGVTVMPGEEIFIRWLDLNDAGNDHGLAVDDLSITFDGAPPVTIPPTITGDPVSRTNNAGTTATFSVTATGTSPTYQWRKDGTPLSDAGNVLGSSSTTLTLTNVLAADIGDYDVIVANSAASVTSKVARLTVLDPVLFFTGGSRTNLAGENVVFSAGANGTPTLSFQWYKDGAALADGGNVAGSTTSALTITSVETANEGSYALVLSNPMGSVTGATVVLHVKIPPGVRLAQWNFNDTNAPATSPPPSAGAGTAALVGYVTAAYASGTTADSTPGATNGAWLISNYPAQGTSNKLAGIQFNVPTTGYKDLLVSWDQRNSGTASRYTRLQYTTDGTTWVDADVATLPPTTYTSFSADLSAASGVSDNANFAVRLVAELEGSVLNNGNDNYVSSTVGGTYGTAGTMRFDLVTVYGTSLGSVTTPKLKSIAVTSGMVTLDFEAGASDAAASFSVVGSVTVSGSYSPESATITALGGGKFQATVPASGETHFYRIKRN